MNFTVVINTDNSKSLDIIVYYTKYTYKLLHRAILEL